MRCLFLVLLGLVLIPDPATAGEKARKPNIVILLADDLGYGDIGVHGAKDVATPHIDSLAKNGVRCTSGYVSAPYCSPTRAGLLTGRYQQRFGHEFNPVLLKNGGMGQGLPRRLRRRLPTCCGPPGTPRASSASGTSARTTPCSRTGAGLTSSSASSTGAHSYLESTTRTTVRWCAASAAARSTRCRCRPKTAT